MIPIPEFEQKMTMQDFARGILGISDIAGQLSELCTGLQNSSSASILTRHVRQMSVSLRSILLEKRGRLLTRVLKDGLFPSWPQQQREVLSRVVVEASPDQELHYEIKESGECRSLKVPGYRHGFVVSTLHGIERSEGDRYAILGSDEIWTSNETVKLKDWVKQEVFEVDGLVYDLDKTIKTVADKEGAHLDQIEEVDSEGIYTGNRENTKSQFTNDDAYIRSRLVKFGPFSYPHILIIFVSTYLVMIARESLKRNKHQVQSIGQQITLAPASLPAIRERTDMIMTSPRIGRINGLPLQVKPERLVMRPPISIGLSSFEEEQARVNNLPQYGETNISIPRCRRGTKKKSASRENDHRDKAH